MGVFDYLNLPTKPVEKKAKPFDYIKRQILKKSFPTDYRRERDPRRIANIQRQIQEIVDDMPTIEE